MTRADQWASFARAVAAFAAIALITVAASIETLRVGPAAAGLLYMLPVLWVSARAGLTSGLVSAGFAVLCYNYFLLEPRYTLRIHGASDVAAFVVLTVVAVVTSRLAASLRVRELEAQQRAEASTAEAELATRLARVGDRTSLDGVALGFFRERYREAMLVRADDLANKRTGLAPLDAAAAAWALHNGALSGHASEVMPSADFRFVPLGRGGEDVLALAADERGEAHPGQVAQTLGGVWAQARDRLSADDERRAREAADAREATRRTLLAALGHDFRTPLTVLKSGLAEIGGAQATLLGSEVDRIVRLSEDLIAAARLENGQAVRLEAVDLVDAVASALPSPAARGQIAVRTDIADDLPLVAGDAVMLVHLIGNLLDNAVRHARSEVTISADANAGQVRLDVRDDGPGIDPAIADTLFDRFASGSDRGGGSGLGLTIARELATAMGATLSAGDADGVGDGSGGGALFTLWLPAFAVAV